MKDKIGRACRTNGKEENEKLWQKNSKERENSEDLGAERRTIS
jgi:hypothetical protein